MTYNKQIVGANGSSPLFDMLEIELDLPGDRPDGGSPKVYINSGRHIIRLSDRE